MNRCPASLRPLTLLVLPFFAACASVPGVVPFLPLDTARALPAANCSLQQQPAPGPDRRWEPKNQVDVMFGGSYWPDLGGLDTNGGGPVFGSVGDFDSWGWAFDLGYDRIISSNRGVSWSLGIESGWTTFESNSVGFYTPYSEITGNMWYVAPAVRCHFELSPRATLIAGIGAGYYGFAIDELTTYYYGWWWGYDSRTLARDDAFGGFASVALDLGLSPGGGFRVESKVHFVEFNGIDSVLPNESSVSGPIWSFEIGYVFKF